MPNNKYIFDLDGTLYQFKGATSFFDSPLYATIKQNIFSFLQIEAGVNSEEAKALYTQLKTDFHGHVSLGVESQLGVDRETYFAKTWNIDPEPFVIFSEEPRQVLEALAGRFAILTEAPRVWAERVLSFLNVRDLAQGVLFAGDPDVRKPSAEAFRQVGEFLAIPFSDIVSVGDQEESDILVPKSLGMQTIRVGSGTTVADRSIDSLGELLV